MSFKEIVTELAEKSNLNLKWENDDSARLLFTETDGRTQLMVLVNIGDLAKFPVVEISSAVTDIPAGPLPGALADKLLTQNDQFKIGSFAIKNLGEKRLLLFHHNMILNRLEPDEFRLILEVVAHTADTMEKDFTGGGDKY